MGGTFGDSHKVNLGERLGTVTKLSRQKRSKRNSVKLGEMDSGLWVFIRGSLFFLFQPSTWWLSPKAAH